MLHMKSSTAHSSPTVIPQSHPHVAWHIIMLLSGCTALHGCTTTLFATDALVAQDTKAAVNEDPDDTTPIFCHRFRSEYPMSCTD